MTHDQKVQLLLAALENAGLILSVVGTAVTALLGFIAYYWKPKLPAILAQSEALLRFRSLLEEALKAAAAKLMNEATAIHNQLDRELAAATTPSERAAAEKKWEEATEALAHRACTIALDEVGHLAPEWVKDSYKMARNVLESVLPKVQELFSKRN